MKQKPQQTQLIHHFEFAQHGSTHNHPECPERYHAIMAALKHPKFKTLVRTQAEPADIKNIERAHSDEMILELQSVSPEEGIAYVDADTYLTPQSLDIARKAAGGAIMAAQSVMRGDVKNAFVACRPPGHHSEKNRAMGFCLYNNAAIAALYALEKLGAKRVAILDFDVHHGNGTQDIAYDNPNIFYASTHESPQFPGTGSKIESGHFHQIHNFPLARGTDGKIFLRIWQDMIVPKVIEFAPDLIILSAGFDAHINDPLGGLELTTQDFANLTSILKKCAQQCCQGRLVSLLEGGYDLEALAQSVSAHIEVLMEPS